MVLQRLITLTLVGLLLWPAAMVSADDAIRLRVNGQIVQPEQPPLLVDGRTLVPIRFVAQAMGIGIKYDAGIPAVLMDHPTFGRYVLYLHKPVLQYPNGQVRTLDVPAQIIQSRTYVPIRFVAEAFGAAVGWDGATRTVTVTSPQPQPKPQPQPQAVSANLQSPPAWPDETCVAPQPTTFFRAVHAVGTWGTNPQHYWEQPREWFDYLKQQNVNWVGVSPVWYLQSRANDAVFQASTRSLRPGGDFTSWPDDGLRKLIRRLRCQGFHVFLSLAVRDQSVDGEYHRYEYWPTETFRQSYAEYVLHYARLAQEEGVGLLGIGTETDTAIHVSQSAWLADMLRQVRAIYQGPITYDQHVDPFLAGGKDSTPQANPRYWWELGGDPREIWKLDFDYIGLSVYDIAAKAGQENDELAQTQRWEAFFKAVETAQQKYAKPVLFLEVGQPNIDPADIGKPLNEAFSKGPVAAGYRLQEDFFRSFFAVADRHDWFRGGFIWEYWVMSEPECWQATCRGIGFTTRGKPADAVVRTYYGERARREDEAAAASPGIL